MWKPAKYIIYVRGKLGARSTSLLGVATNNGFGEKGHRGTKFQRTISLSKWAGEIYIMLIFPVAVDLKTLVLRMSPKLPEAT